MLICKKCSAQCSDEAKFCRVCGERIDGKKRCESCGAWNKQDTTFCPTCGARVDGKTSCSACGTLFEGNFCPECGKPVKQAKTLVQTQEKAKNKPTSRVGEKVKSISELVSGACMALGALFALIFVFFIGLEASILGSALSGMGLPTEDTNLNLYYFFGKIYEEHSLNNIIGDSGTMQRWFSLMLNARVQEYAIVGTIVSALILLVVAGTAITALTLYILKWCNKTQKSAYGWGMAAIISFIVGVFVFAGLNNVAMHMLKDTEAVSMVWTGATTAGFVLCAVFGGLAIVAKVLAQGSAPWQRDRILKTVLSLVGVALVCVWLGAVSGLGMQIQLFVTDASGSTNVKVNMDVNLGFTLFSWFLTNAFPYNALSADADFIKSKVYTISTMSLISQILAIALIVLVAVILLSQIKNLHKERAKSNTLLVLSIVVWALSLALCILCAITVGAIQDCSKRVVDYLISGMNFLDPEMTKYVGYNVAFTMVMSSIVLVYAIVQKIFERTQQKKLNAI